MGATTLGRTCEITVSQGLHGGISNSQQDWENVVDTRVTRLVKECFASPFYEGKLTVICEPPGVGKSFAFFLTNQGTAHIVWCVDSPTTNYPMVYLVVVSSQLCKPPHN